jgi:hypothetical protein
MIKTDIEILICCLLLIVSSIGFVFGLNIQSISIMIVSGIVIIIALISFAFIDVNKGYK